jgi:hypothetical protein
MLPKNYESIKIFHSRELGALSDSRENQKAKKKITHSVTHPILSSTPTLFLVFVFPIYTSLTLFVGAICGPTHALTFCFFELAWGTLKAFA